MICPACSGIEDPYEPCPVCHNTRRVTLAEYLVYRLLEWLHPSE